MRGHVHLAAIHLYEQRAQRCAFQPALGPPPACTLVGINENEPDVLRVFPNPTTGQVTVTRPTESLVSLRVVDSVGCTVYAEQLSAATATINVGELASGYYSLIVEQASRTTSKPLMVMH